jgi:hypothetical protein
MVWIQLVPDLREKTALDFCLSDSWAFGPFVCFYGGKQEKGGCD